MKKYPLIGGSIFAVVVLVLCSLNNIVGYQTVQASNQKIINTEVDQKELLFQTILDIANNKEIQRIVLKAQINRELFPNSDAILPLFNNPVLTKNQLKQMYFVGLLLSKTISKSKIHSILEQYKVRNHAVQKEISVVIEKDITLTEDMNRLTMYTCNCENENTTRWSFPVLCILLVPFLWLAFILYGHHIIFLLDIFAKVSVVVMAAAASVPNFSIL